MNDRVRIWLLRVVALSAIGLTAAASTDPRSVIAAAIITMVWAIVRSTIKDKD